MAKKEEKSQAYGALILKRDGDFIVAIESDNYDEVYETWQKLKDQWAECVKESKPFELTSPIVTAFDPNLIYEITVKPVVETASNKHNNPYKAAMQKHGFANTLGNSQILSDVKDGGYL